MISFPNRVWEPSTWEPSSDPRMAWKPADQETLWVSRPVTEADHARRNKLSSELMADQLAGEMTKILVNGK